jgi:hypothetical protein
VRYILYASVIGTISTAGALVIDSYLQSKVLKRVLWTLTLLQFFLPILVGPRLSESLLTAVMTASLPMTTNEMAYRLFFLELVQKVFFLFWMAGAVAAMGFFGYQTRQSPFSPKRILFIFIRSFHWFNPAIGLGMHMWHRNWVEFGKNEKNHIDRGFLA